MAYSGTFPHNMFTQEHEYFQDGQIFHGFAPHIMGTKLEMLVCGAPETLCGSLWEEMCEEAVKLDAIMNRFAPSSEVSRLNEAGGGCLSPEMAEIISLCGHYRESTAGLFDIGRGTVDWGSAMTGPSSISLGGGNIDFGGFGKGYLLKKFSEMMRREGITTAYVDFGGSSIMALGHHPYGNCWKVGVTDPFSGSLVREIELTDMSMSTSGNQPGYVGHITDPRNGNTINSKRMVTILSRDPLTAEIASTAAMIADTDTLDFIQKNNDIAEIFVHNA